jgi:hypothetical protein
MRRVGAFADVEIGARIDAAKRNRATRMIRELRKLGYRVEPVGAIAMTCERVGFRPCVGLKIALLCSTGSQVLRRGPTPLKRACPLCG